MFPYPSAIPLADRTTERTAEDAERAIKLPVQLARAAVAEAEPTPYDVVHEENALSLRHYAPTERRHDVPVVIAYAFVNDPSILDLEPGRSVVGQFLDGGFDVYVVDWGDPSRLDASLTLDDYVTRYLANCVDVARDRAGVDAVHLLGYSTGAPLVAMYAALFPDAVRSLLLQGPPLDFDADGGMFAFRDLLERVDPALVADALGTVPAPLMDGTFALRKPVEFSATSAAHAWDDLVDAAAVEHDARMATWIADGPDMAGATYRQFVEALLLGNRLVENDLELGERHVDLENVEMPVALIVGRDDEFVPPAASLPFLDAVPSDDTAVFEFPTDHVGLSVSAEAHADGWPRVVEWVAERS